MRLYIPSLFAFALLLGISACQHNTANTGDVVKETARANAFFERVFSEYLFDHPQAATFLADKRNYSKWNDYSFAGERKDYETSKRTLAALHDSFPLATLDKQAAISYHLLERQMKEQIEGYEKFPEYYYIINHMNGLHSDMPAMLINMHRIDSLPDAQAYIDRISGFSKVFDDVVARLMAAQKGGIVPPAFILDKCIDDCKGVLKGTTSLHMNSISVSVPCNILYTDFNTKLAEMVKKGKLSVNGKQEMMSACTAALNKSFVPAYQKLLACLTTLRTTANDDAGVWKFPKGKEYYAFCLRHETTTDMTPDAIHALGLKEVARIHEEMKGIMQKVGFKGDLQAFFEFMRTDKRFYYPQTDEGKRAYVAKATAIIDSMRARLPRLFITLPKAPLVVKVVEPFREKTAASAFYDAPAPDGSRPGTYYLNTYDMKSQSTYEMEALAYHEGIPGHHMQLAISQQLTTLPRFRRFSDGFTAYVEGWGLYSEYTPKEMGFYVDPYSDFGRLSMELFRSVRLVVDTGIHFKKWSREEARKYYAENTPTNTTEIEGMVDRHIVWAGQATAYKVGMLKILELRKKAKDALGAKFDIRKFHETVLTNGALPLDVLETLVDDYIREAK